MIKNIFFLFLAYWGTRKFIEDIPNSEAFRSNEILLYFILDPNSIVQFTLMLLLGIVGVTKSVSTILENVYNVVKSSKRFDIEMVLHFLSFNVVVYLLYVMEQWITVVIVLLCILFGAGSFYKTDKKDNR